MYGELHPSLKAPPGMGARRHRAHPRAAARRRRHSVSVAQCDQYHRPPARPVKIFFHIFSIKPLDSADMLYIPAFWMRDAGFWVPGCARYVVAAAV